MSLPKGWVGAPNATDLSVRVGTLISFRDSIVMWPHA